MENIHKDINENAQINDLGDKEDINDPGGKEDINKKDLPNDFPRQNEPKSVDKVIVVKVNLPHLSLTELKLAAKTFAEAANILDKFDAIEKADTMPKIQEIIEGLVEAANTNIDNKKETSKVTTEWLEKMVKVYHDSVGSVKEPISAVLENTLGKLDKLVAFFKLEKFAPLAEKIKGKSELPTDSLELAFSGISMIWMLMEGCAHMSQGVFIKKLGKEIVEMKRNLEHMHAGQDKINLQKGIQSLEYYLSETKSELVQEVFSYLINYGHDVTAISKKVMEMIVKTLSPKASLGFAAAGAGLMAIQQSYALYRSIQTQLGIKKFHESAQQKEATYDLGEQGTKELYIKKIIKNEDKEFVTKLGLDMVDLDYTSASSIYDALKNRGLKLEEAILTYDSDKKMISVTYKNKGISFEASKDFYVFLEGKAVLDKIAAANPQEKAKLEKKHRSLLKQREKILQNKESRYKVYEEMKEFAGQCGLWIEDKEFLNGIKEGVNTIKSAEALYRKLGIYGYNLKPSQIISEGRFPVVYYLTGPNVMGGYPLKMRINKEMAIFLRYQASGDKGKLGLKKEYDKMINDPIQDQEILRDFRALLQNESARSAFIQNKAEEFFNTDKIPKLIEEIKNKIPKTDLSGVVFKVALEHKDLQDPEKLYDYLVGSFSIKEDLPLFKLPVSIQIDTSRLSKKGDKYFFNTLDKEKPVPISKELYDFLLSRGSVVPLDKKNNILIDLKSFLQKISKNSVVDTLLHDAAMAQVRQELILFKKDAPDSILNKRKIAEEQKIERSEKLLPEVLDEINQIKNLSPQEKLQKLQSKGFHLEALLEYNVKGKVWEIEGYKGEVTPELAKLISPQKVIQKSIDDIKHTTEEKGALASKNIGTAIDELVEEKNKTGQRLNEIEIKLKDKKIGTEEKQKLQQEKMLLKEKDKSINNLIVNLNKFNNEDNIARINVNINLQIEAMWDKIPKEERFHIEEIIMKASEKDRKFIEIEMKQEFFLRAAQDGRLEKWLKNEPNISSYIPRIKNLAAKKQIFLDALEILEEAKVLGEKPVNVSNKLGEILSDKEVQKVLTTRRGQGIDTRNTLFKQMTKVIKTEKIRQERVFNAHKARANFVGLLGSTALAVVGILAIVGVIGLASSVVGLAVVGFGLMMVAVGLMILKAKKPNLFRATMRGVPFRLAFNNMKKSWYTMRQKKIEKKAFFDSAQVELISAKAIPKAEVDRFLKMVELNKGELPPWKMISPPMQRMIAALNGVSIEKLGVDWEKQKVENLIDIIQKQSSREVSTTLIDNFILRLTELKKVEGKAPDWDSIDSRLKPMILKILKKTEETIKEHWESKYQGEDSKIIKKNIQSLIEDLNKEKSSLQKSYATYNKLEDRLGRQQERIVAHKIKLDLAAENDFALKLAKELGIKNNFDLGALAWDEIIAGEGAEDNDLAQLLRHEMGIDVKKMMKGKEGLQREVMEDEFQKGFLGFLGMQGQAFVEEMHSLGEQIQNDFSNPVEIEFKYGK